MDLEVQRSCVQLPQKSGPFGNIFEIGNNKLGIFEMSKFRKNTEL